MNLANNIENKIAKVEAVLALINRTYKEAIYAGKTPQSAHQAAMDAAYYVLDATQEEKAAAEQVAKTGMWIKP